MTSGIYLSSSCITAEKISQVLSALGKYGITNIELSGGTNYCGTLAEDLIRLKAEYGFSYACHAYFPPPKQPFVVNLASGNEQIYKRSIEHYEKCMELMQRIGCCTLSVHGGFFIEVGVEEIGREISDSRRYDRYEAILRFCAAYEGLQKKAKQAGIQMYIENNVLSRPNYDNWERQNYLMMTDYESIMELRHLIDFDLLLDLGHLYVSCHTLGLDFAEQVRKLKKYVRWLHLSENNGITDEHRVLSQGSPIYTAFRNIYTSGLKVTLEAQDTLEHVVKNYRWIEEICRKSCENMNNSNRKETIPR